ncbi:hypothetical protein B0H14DRAFT_1397875 [Mycena olivaceomarginata]|nr:hypothetical protein B0H14DRAFT_1397875 [Mycena olivaceomarginata]
MKRPTSGACSFSHFSFLLSVAARSCPSCQGTIRVVRAFLSAVPSKPFHTPVHDIQSAAPRWLIAHTSAGFEMNGPLARSEFSRAFSASQLQIMPSGSRILSSSQAAATSISPPRSPSVIHREDGPQHNPQDSSTRAPIGGSSFSVCASAFKYPRTSRKSLGRGSTGCGFRLRFGRLAPGPTPGSKRTERSRARRFWGDTHGSRLLPSLLTHGSDRPVGDLRPYFLRPWA